MVLTRVRFAAPTDLRVLARIYDAVRTELGSPDAGGFTADTEGETLLVADLGERVLGFVAVFEPEAFVHHLYVDAQHRGRGIGSALLKAAVTLSARQLWLKVDAPNRAARTFYRRHGWREEPPVEGVIVMRGPQPDA